MEINNIKKLFIISLNMINWKQMRFRKLKKSQKKLSLKICGIKSLWIYLNQR